MRISKHRNGSLETITLRALLNIQKFVEDGGGGMGVTGLSGNWKPVSDVDGDGGARVFVQTGSRMNDLDTDTDDLPI